MQWPDRIELDHPDGVVLRRMMRADAAATATAVRANLEHLAPWMPWANEQSCDPEFQRDRLTKAEATFADGTDVGYYLVRGSDEATILGAISVMDRCGPGTAELGYWIDRDCEGRGWIRAAAATMTDLALTDPTIDRVLAFCDPANERSAAIPLALGFTDDGEVDDHPLCGRARAFSRTR